MIAMCREPLMTLFPRHGCVSYVSFFYETTKMEQAEWLLRLELVALICPEQRGKKRV